MAQGFAFIALALLLILLAGLALLRLSMMRIESPLGRHGDGLRAMAKAPTWNLPDAAGTPRRVPNGQHHQALLFTDHAIASFPQLAAGIAQLAAGSPALELLVLTRSDAETTRAICRAVDLELPVVAVDDQFYKRHNVWVVPHILILDETGTVLVAGNVSEAPGLANMWRHAQLLTAGAP